MTVETTRFGISLPDGSSRVGSLGSNIKNTFQSVLWLAGKGDIDGWTSIPSEVDLKVFPASSEATLKDLHIGHEVVISHPTSFEGKKFAELLIERIKDGSDDFAVHGPH